MVQIVAAALLAIVALAGCGGAQPPTNSPAVPSQPSGSASTPHPSGTRGPATGTDKEGDLRKPSGKRANGPGYVDVLEIEAGVTDGQLSFVLTMAANVPESMPSTVAEINYLVVIDSIGDGDWDYWISLTNLENGAWTPTLTDWIVGHDYAGPAFPGSVIVKGDSILGGVPITALGNADHLRVCVVTQRSKPHSGDLTAEDNAPTDGCLEGAGWITVVG